MVLSHLPALLATLARGAALSVALALPAAAATMQAVYTGTVTSSDDQTGVFGGTGNSLAGLAFTMTFRYDTAAGAIYDEGHYKNLFGGPLYSSTSPIFYAALTINGVTQTLDISQNSSVSLRDESVLGFTQTAVGHFGQDFFYDGVFEDSDYFQGFMSSGDGSFPIPLDFAQPFTIELDPLNGTHYGYGAFSFLDYDHITGTYGEFANGYMIATRLEVTTISAVPLPAGLPLLAFALGGLAILARRRRAGIPLH